MIARSRRALAPWIIACLTLALAAVGGYRLGSSASSTAARVRIAGSLGTVWVSRSGSDANNTSPNFCQLLTPCQSFPVAAGVVSPGGEIGTLDAGRFNSGSALDITQSVTIDGGGGGNATTFAFGSDGVTINAGASDVVILRHLRIHATGFVAGTAGVRLNGGKTLILNDVDIDGFDQGVSAALTSGGSHITILNSRIHDNTGAGVAVSTSTGTVHVNISHSSILDNAYGIINGDGSVLDLSDTVIAGNSSIGLGAQTYGILPSLIHATHNQLDNNPYAIWENHGAGNAQIIIWLSDNDVVNNTVGIYGNFGGTLAVFSFGNNRLANNATPGGVNGVASQT